MFLNNMSEREKLSELEVYSVFLTLKIDRGVNQALKLERNKTNIIRTIFAVRID